MVSASKGLRSIRLSHKLRGCRNQAHRFARLYRALTPPGLSPGLDGDAAPALDFEAQSVLIEQQHAHERVLPVASFTAPWITPSSAGTVPQSCEAPCTPPVHTRH